MPCTVLFFFFEEEEEKEEKKKLIWRNNELVEDYDETQVGHWSGRDLDVIIWTVRLIVRFFYYANISVMSNEVHVCLNLEPGK